LRIVTGNSKWNDGNVSVKVNGAVLKEESYWGKGEDVARVCYGTPISSVHVKNSIGNAWGGSIEYSSDSGENFSPMLCTKGCDKVGPASKIAVDADKKTGMKALVKCLKANWCELNWYHLAPAGAATCDMGVNPTENECEVVGINVLTELGMGITKKPVTLGMVRVQWSIVPSGCSVRISPPQIIFNRHAAGSGHGKYPLVCSSEVNNTEGGE